MVAADFSSPPQSPGGVSPQRLPSVSAGAGEFEDPEDGPQEHPGRDAVLSHLKSSLQPLYNRGGITKQEFIGAVKNALAAVLAGGPDDCRSAGWRRRCSHALALQLSYVSFAPPPAPPPPAALDSAPADDRSATPPPPPAPAPSSPEGGVPPGQRPSFFTFEERQQQRERQLRDWKKAQIDQRSAGNRAAVIRGQRSSPCGTPRSVRRAPGSGISPENWRPSPRLLQRPSPSPASSRRPRLSYAARAVPGASTPRSVSSPRPKQVPEEAKEMMASGAAKIEKLVLRLGKEANKGGLRESKVICDAVLQELRSYTLYASLVAASERPLATASLDAFTAMEITDEETGARAFVEAAREEQFRIAEEAYGVASAALQFAAQKDAHAATLSMRAESHAAITASQSSRIERLFSALEEKERKLEQTMSSPPPSPPRSGVRRRASVSPAPVDRRGSLSVSPRRTPGSPRSDLRRGSTGLFQRLASVDSKCTLTMMSGLSTNSQLAGPSSGSGIVSSSDRPPDREAVVEYIRTLLQPLYNSGAMSQHLFADVVRGVSKELFQRKWRGADEAVWKAFVKERIAKLVELHQEG
eukprot:Hpha_TRINITY_DN35012_c0_g1::TRINITY_DN35012_c0_g1_i1::g.82693::m.82693